MATPLTFQPRREDIRLEAVLSALGDPTRLRIAAALNACGETSCGGLGLEMPKSSVSHHFRILREAGVVTSRQEGTQRILKLRREDLEARFPGLLAAVLSAADGAVNFNAREARP